ncbi:MAG: ATP-binding cassette, subfamily er 3 [Eubacteriaceae bacterium]|nr:ATP-binding cassette, subfamily er 3 [Eubacteriaceae bacterium]MDK2960886.1 ATP-binding cassette, subfamily er 3 [Eubacteriaceae bacterium]MDN5307029.1 ATP-binding cassette, subfamily er 3 [Eubacteriaceae bacterium]
MILNIENLHFSYGITEIFNRVNLTINENEQIGLVGQNGTGKSTFLKLLTENLIPDSGNIFKKKQLNIGYLAQEPEVIENQTLNEVFYSVFESLQEMECKITELGEKIASASEENQELLIKEFGELQDAFTEVNGYEYPSRIRGVANGLNFSADDLKKPFSQLSGGQKTRACLGKMLLMEPELLLLDEPTNYLDIETLQWLEQYLNTYRGTFIIISHDRYFLDKVCHKILEVNRKTINVFEGNYTSYALKKKQLLIEMDHQYTQQMKEVKQQQAIIDRFRQYNSIKSSKRAASREKALQKIELLEKVETTKVSHFNFKPRIKSGNDVLRVEQLKKSFNQKLLFENIDFEIQSGDKIGIIGPNGIGKTTLLKILLKQIPADSGLIQFGHKVFCDYFDQEHDSLTAFQNDNLLETIWDVDSKLTEGEIRNILAAFLFQGEDVFKTVNTLSGGEKARLLLARLMISQANFLLMDEPTNHIDMDTKEILENALTQYDGTLLFISHDRYFINRIANKIYLFSDKGIEVFLGNYDDYLRHQTSAAERLALQEQEHLSSPTKTQIKNDRRKQKEAETKIRQLKKNIRSIEENLIKLENEIKSIEAQMCKPSFYDDQQLVTETSQAYELKKKELEKMTDEWENALLHLESLES